MAQEIVWISRLEGIIFGIAIFCIIKAILNNRLQRSLQCIGLFWIVVLVIQSVRDLIQSIPLLFVIHIPVIQFILLYIRSTVLLYYFKRFNVKRRRLKVVKYFVFIAFLSTQVAFTYVFTITMKCVFLENGCIPTTFPVLITLDIVSNTFYMIIVVLLDIMFMLWFSYIIYKGYGGKTALKYRPFIFHVFLQICIITSIVLNLFRLIYIIPGQNQILSPFWMYPDTFLILSLLEYGTSYPQVLRKSIKDSTHDQLQSAIKETYTTKVTKNNILKYLHHSLRNKIQRYSYLIQDMKQVFDNDKIITYKMLHALESMSDRFTSLVQDIQSFDDIQSKKTIQCRFVTFYLSEVVCNEIESLQTSGDNDGTTIVQLSLPDSCWVNCDINLIRQLISLIYEIFVEYKLAHSLHICFEKSTFIINLKTRYTELAVDYNNMNELDNYFVITYSIVTEIVKTLAGEILCSFDHITISIPMSRITNIVVEDKKQSEDPCLNQVSKIRSILLVDDSSINRKLTKKMFMMSVPKEYHDYLLIDEAENGRMAVDKIEETLNDKNILYDLVLLDVMMPVMDGKTACKEIKSRWKEIYIIMLTANDADSLHDIPYDEYLQKPFSKDDIHHILKTYGFPTKT